MKSLKLERKNFKISTIIYLTFLLVIFISTEVNGKKSGKNSNVLQKIIKEKANEISNEDFVIGSKKSGAQIGNYSDLKNMKLENSNEFIMLNKESHDKDKINNYEDLNKSTQEKIVNTKSLKFNSIHDSNKDDNITNSNDEFKTIESGTLFSLTVTFFIAGFGDKSFFIATIASIRYNKIVCILASFFSLVLMGVLSVFLGIEISAFVAPWIIDLFSSILFIFMGVKMIIEGIETSEDLHFMKLNEDEKTITKASAKLLNDENNNLNINDKINEQNKKFLDEYENGDITISSKETAVESQNEKLIFEISSNYEEEELIKSKTSKKLERQFEKDFKEYQKLEKSLLQSIDTSLTIEEKAELIQKLKEERSMFDEEFSSETSLSMQFINVFSLVSIGEIGDRSQVSIMYASSLSSFKNIVLAVIFSNIILSMLSCFLGNIIAYKFNVRSLTLASGFLFVFLGFCALIMTIIQDFGIVNSN